MVQGICKKKAFTLIELLVVIAIVGILSGFVVVQMNGATRAANDAKVKANLDTIKKATVMLGVSSKGVYPVETGGCTIGSCTNLDPVIKEYLPNTIPGTYTYQSDGTAFTLSSALSTGYAYQFDSGTNTYSTNSPINGSCGTSNNQNLSSVPTTNLCTLGTATVVAGTGPWTWSCAGIHGGTTASCQTGNVPLDGVCGTAHSSNSYTTPSTNLCSAGTPSVVAGTGPWTWSCNGLNTGSNASCSTNKIIDGSCGSANKTYAYSDSSYGSDAFCTLGTTTPTTLAFPDNGATTNWTCVGLNTGSTANCSATRNNTPINGSCGTSNNSNSYSIPTTNLCTLGTASAVSGSGPWSWTCTGLYAGSTANCSANLSVNGACGTKNGKYAATTPTGTQACATGTITGMTGSYSWTCTGLYGGTSPSCSTAAATYAVQSFTAVGTTTWTVPAGVTSVEYLVVGGGGGGSQGGGGAGGFRTGTGFSVSGSISVIVGAGGSGVGANGGSGGGTGGSSTFSTITSYGGGGGGLINQNAPSGTYGSGGGAGGSGSGVATNGASGTTGQGNYGGNGAPNYNTYSGGGGGSSANGGAGDQNSSICGNGGSGTASSISGTSLYYSGGGGGGSWTAGVWGLGGSSIGGIGGYGGSTTGTAGAVNTGSGGGGTGQIGTGGNGGSGIVIIKYINNY